MNRVKFGQNLRKEKDLRLDIVISQATDETKDPSTESKLPNDQPTAYNIKYR